jgi:hypothetical protein
VATRIAPRDENDLAKVKRRGRELSGPSMALNMFLRDDSDEILCRVNRFDYDKIAQDIVERGKAGKAIYAIKGTVPKDFRMISIQKVKYIGDMESYQVRSRETNPGKKGTDSETLGNEGVDLET